MDGDEGGRTVGYIMKQHVFIQGFLIDVMHSVLLPVVELLSRNTKKLKIYTSLPSVGVMT